MQRPITIKWPDELLEETKEVAKILGLRYQSYIKMCVKESNKKVIKGNG